MKDVGINIKAIKWPIIISIIIFVIMFIVIVLFIGKVATNMNKRFNDSSSISDVSAFNSRYELDAGIKSYIFVEETLSDVISDNKKGNHTITVIYKETKTSNPNEIKELKNSLDKSKEYDISFDYNDKGFINKMIIEDI